ncbi:response regulator [Candidatus Nitrotoga sp. AM1P]|uniref:response regulator n=1 Tax=Candidatus Nitrotoga sp. AM1P TaxID=2559597 RepID=UPI0010B82C0C|nr:response regulator [Candidatus Nitrotoga sp. AM1P]BBJ23619.1 response regulator [Candidatus Nitrotoga sp. AM1P]
MADKLVRILYVEDEPDIQMVAQLALEALGGYTMAICSSGDEALQLAPAFQPQLFLLDVMMPGMDGPSTLKMLRTLPQFTHTPVIFMTAKVQPGEVAGYKELGVIDVIPKPFDPMMLASRVEEIWGHYHD